jgi:Zn-dependent M28 family amino/carboxypeptidase
VEHGWRVARQAFTVDGRPVANIEAEVRGADLADEIVVLGAHYDTYTGSPGGNDNASGVAGMLELARVLKVKRPARTVRLVGFVNEEPPFFQTPTMGSWVYAKRCRRRGEKVTGMISLDAIGRYSEARHSQRCPLPFSVFYPDTGDFLAFIGNMLSRGLIRRTIGTFRKTVKFPSEGISAPGILGGIGWSDHWSFWQEGYRALTITDTSDERYKEYHTKADTAELLDYDRMARVMSGVAGIMTDLAGAQRD